MVTFKASIRSAKATTDDAITTRSVGIPVTLCLDPEFSGLAKTFCARNGDTAVDVVLTGDATETVIPPDVLQTTGQLQIGIYAANGDGDIVIPTVWALVGFVQPGTIPSGVDPAEPTPSWVAQVQQTAENALDVAESVREDADAGEFDGFSPSATVTQTETGATITITDKDGTTTAEVENGEDAVVDSALDTDSTNAVENRVVALALNQKAGILRDTASGSIVSFVPDASVENLLGLSVSVEPVQDLHGYDNPWPAGGGSNLVPGIIEGIELDTTSGDTKTNVNWWTSEYIPIAENSVYSFGGTVSRTCIFYDENYSKISNISPPAGSSFTSPPGAKYARINSTITGYDKPVFAKGDTVPPWTPYSNECPISGWDSVKIWVQPTHDTSVNPTATIQLGQTVYGGTLDVTAGTITVDRVMLDPNLLQIGEVNNTGDGRTFFNSSPASTNALSQGQKFMSNYLAPRVAIAYEALLPNEYRANPNTPSIVICAPGADTTKEQMLEWYSQNGIQFSYLLATPFTLTLTPTQIATLQGENNVWSNAGDVTVDFAADLKTYIDNKFNELSTAIAALN